MKNYMIHFSPTGGTKKVMDILTKEFLISQEIDLCKTDFNGSEFKFEKKDICFIGVPSYGGRVPKTVIERLKEMNGNDARAVLVIVYGNRDYDDTVLELKNEVTVCGFQVKAAVAAVAEHSIMRQFGTGRPDAADEKELLEFSKKIRTSLEKQALTQCEVPGNYPYKEYNGVPMKPKGNNNCSHCGTCADLCPVGAIPKDNPASVDKNACISCMRCISVCPRHAREVNKLALMAASKKLNKVCSGRKRNQLFIS